MSSFFKSSGSVDTGTLPQSGSDVASNTEANTAITSFFKNAGANSTDEATISASVDAAALSEANAATSETNAANSAASALQSRNTATSAIATVTAARDLTLGYRDTAEDHKDAAASSATAAASSASAASTDADDAETAKAAAVDAQASAEQAETDAQTAQAAAEQAETNAETAQAASEAARDLALSYRNTALSHKNAAETAEENAETAEQNALTSETNAADSETNAASSASSASSSASSATTSASTATTKAGEASDSAADAQKLAINTEDSQFTLSDNTTTGYSALHHKEKAAASATAAASSASAASTSAGEASSSETNASNSASAASSSASAASTSAGTATTKAGEASTSAGQAASSATTASTSASAASTSASNASTSASNAATSASNASTAQSAAESARDSALAAYDNFDDRYLGVKSSAPSVDNDGDALVAGSLFFDSTNQKMQLYSGTAWVDAYVQGGDVVFKSQSNTGITGTLEFVGGVSYDPSFGTSGSDTSTTAAIALSNNMSIVKPIFGYIRNLFKTNDTHDIVIGNEINTSYQNNVNIYSSNTGHINLYDGHQRVFSTTADGVKVEANNANYGLVVNKDNTSGMFFRAMYNGTVGNRPYGLKPPSSDSTTEPFTWETNNCHAFSTDGVERMRIKDSGVDVTGLLSATTKSFDIEHPTKPGMRLRYGVLEGPENGVYVRGRLTSFSTIQLPEHWKGLVHEDSITVQLTPIGRKQDLWVEYVDLERVEICKNNIDCFYVVWAERKDVPKLEVEYAPEV